MLCQFVGCTNTATEKIIAQKVPVGLPNENVEILVEVCSTHYNKVSADRRK